MTWRNKRDHINNYTCKWRRSKLGKTNPNYHYFSRLLKQETDDYLASNKEYLLENKPEIYYSMKGQKLPKKYQQKQGISIAPVNAFVPPQSKLSSDELRKQLDKDVKERKLKVQKEYELRQENKRKEVIKQRNQKAYARVIFIGLIPIHQLIITSWDHHKLGKLKKSTSIMIENDYVIN